MVGEDVLGAGVAIERHGQQVKLAPRGGEGVGDVGPVDAIDQRLDDCREGGAGRERDRVGQGAEGLYEGANVSVVQQGSGVKVEWLDTNAGITEKLQCAAP